MSHKCLNISKMHIFIFSKQLKILTELGYFNINVLEIDTDDTKTRLDVSAKKKNTKRVHMDQ